jgi:hypothetical protein
VASVVQDVLDSGFTAAAGTFGWIALVLALVARSPEVRRR